MTKKRIQPGSTHGFIGDKPKSKTKPRDIPEQLFLDMVRERDRVFYAEAKLRGDTEMMTFLKNRHEQN